MFVCGSKQLPRPVPDHALKESRSGYDGPLNAR